MIFCDKLYEVVVIIVPCQQTWPARVCVLWTLKYSGKFKVCSIVHRDASSWFRTAPCMRLVYKKSKYPLKEFSLERETQILDIAVYIVGSVIVKESFSELLTHHLAYS